MPEFLIFENRLVGNAQHSPEPPMGGALLPDLVFCALRQFTIDNEQAEGLFTFMVQKGREYIRVHNYVGLLTLPDGSRLEILPKIDQQSNTRPLLLAMLRHLRNSPFRTLRTAHSRAVRIPLWEVFITAFLDTVNALAQQGIQRAYVTVEGNERFWKGRFQAARQQRDNACHAERLAVVYDTLTASVPPNRILKTALVAIRTKTTDQANKRRIHQLLSVLDEVSLSDDVRSDLLAVRRSNRLFTRYETALCWAEMLLMGQGPGVKKGDKESMALLFPMERVFEDYVAHGIRTHWPNADQISVQESSAHLIDEHVGVPRFKLRPDVIIRHQDRTFVMDTKWKQVNGSSPDTSSRTASYGIEQADMYQVYAYGKKYAANDLFLIYPANPSFREPLPVFAYDATTRLHVVPFDVTNSLANEVEKLALYALSF
ncbi:McrC family protein [Spirosoma sp.]|uniref:McrC family protein n=1 Tax=Spirosoma sp. TaxID=1899569 RepID=UPI002626ADBE|nr:McrC family protein [Spirosoma sp.]MCX6216769.1 McrC family protein [Spirosoma sp.]